MSTSSRKPSGHTLFQVSQKVIIYDPKTNFFLLLKASDPSLGAVDSFWYEHFGPWDFPGGRIDGKEDLLGAVEREVKEEVGRVQLEILGFVVAERLRYSMAEVFVPAYLAIHKGGEPVLSKEHTEYRWVTAEEVGKSDEYKPWVKNFVKAAAERLREREYLNDARRIQADFDNYKKRQAEAQKELSGYLIEKFLMDILPVMDNFRAATAHVPESEQGSPWVTGIQYIEKQLEKVLEDNGVSVIAVAEGDTFDPAIHEAVEDVSGGEFQDENPKKGEGGKQIVVKVLQNGYRISERVVRPAKVSVK